MKDELFKKAAKKQFEFDESVASVFDDMINRSVPFYKENLTLLCNLLARLLCKNAKICDLGCSSANFLLFLASLRSDFKLFGVDNSAAMIKLAKAKTKAFGAKISFFEADLSKFEFFKNDAFLANYTLQFIRPPKRQALVNKIYENLNKNGVFVLSEKIIYENASLAKNIIELYENYKQSKGYTKFEIASKRQALENVLIPYTEAENIAMLKNAGFKRVESLFKWANFQSFVGFKD